MLQLILGKSGFGKSEYIRNIAIEKTKNGENVIVLVPDQMSFETEKSLLYKAGEELFAKMRVYHFGRLTRDIFSKFGRIKKMKIDNISKNIVMTLAINECSDQFETYANTKKSQLVPMFLNAIDEFRTCNIPSEKLSEISGKLNDSFKQKLYEFNLVYATYEELLKDTYTDDIEMEKYAVEVARENNYFENTTILLDGFEGFDKNKIAMLKLAFENCKDVYASFCIDDLQPKDDNSIFLPIHNTVKKVLAITKEIDMQVEQPLILNEAFRFKNDELKFLEENFYRYKTDKIKNNHVKFYEAWDVHEELEYVCATIKNMVTQGKTYNDFTVICRNNQKYMHLIESTFKKWEIPSFVARPRAIESSSLIRLIASCFNIVEYGYSSSDILNIAKSNICGFNTHEIYELENYLYLWRIEGNELKKEFKKSPLGFSDKDCTEELAVLEEYRKRLVQPIENFKKNCKTETGESIAKAVYNLLLEYNVNEELVNYCHFLNNNNEKEQEEEQERIYGELMMILDQFARIIGSEHITVKEFGDILKIVSSRSEILNIPQKLDSVIFGCADNLKRESDVVFMVGCVQDEFPVTPVETGVFNNFERRSLIENDIELQTSLQEEMLLERYYAYSSACSARENLFVTYHLYDGKSSCSKGELISRFDDIFELSYMKNLPLEYFANTKESLFSSYARLCSKDSTEKDSLKAVLGDFEEYKGRVENLDRIVNKEPFKLTASISREIFAQQKKPDENDINSTNTTKQRKFSPSQIEKYHQCKFAYFCNYGLGAKERKIAQIDVLQYGTLMHYIFEKFLALDNFKELEYDEISHLIKLYIQEYKDEKLGKQNSLSQEDLYRFARMEQTAILLIQRTIDELNQSEFEPMFRELKFDENTKFPPLKVKTDHEEVIVGGIVDRVDIYEKDGIKYARIVDYKTGSKEFKFIDVLNGLGLQMLVYLEAIKEAKYNPAGVLYMHCETPQFSVKKSLADEKALIEQKNKLCMDGLVLQDKDIITAMEKNLGQNYIPVSFTEKTKTYKTKPPKTETTYKGKENLVDEIELDVIFEYTKKLISDMYNNLVDGNIEAKPLTVGKNSCEYCPFGSVCGVESKEVDKITISKEDAIKKMKGEINKNEQKSVDESTTKCD